MEGCSALTSGYKTWGSRTSQNYWTSPLSGL